MNKKRVFLLISFICAVCFTAFAVLDTFVITKVYATVETQTVSETADVASDEATDEESSSGTSDTSGEEADSSSSENESGSQNEEVYEETTTSKISDPIITDTTYTDDNISISITTYREYDTNIYVADVTLSSPEYLKTAFAGNSYGKNITAKTSDIAASVGAILAINGDFYGVQEAGYVLKNSVLYRNTAREDQEDLVIYEDGSFEVINEDDVSAETLLENGARNILSFGPALVSDGEIAVSENDEVDKSMASNPRTAIGIIDDLHYVFVVSDGRTSENEGLSLYQLAGFMKDLGVTCAYNLDGGGSSTMVFNGTVINNPTSGGGHHSDSSTSSERSVSDIVYIG